MSDRSSMQTCEQGFTPVHLGEIAHIEMGQSPDSRYVFEDSFLGYPFLQGNAEFGTVSPEPKYGCTRPAKTSESGDVLISVRAPVGAVNIADQSYCIGRGLAAIRVRGVEPSLAAHLIASQAAALRRVAQGTTFEAISKKDLMALKLRMPPLDELPVIAQIVDTLDTAIRETEALIDKLKAVKQGLLHDLLTRGIDTNGQLRPPQSEAPQLYKESPLGWIPREWDASQLCMLTKLITSGSRGWAAYYAESGALFLRSQNVRMGYLDLTDRQLVKPPTGGEGERTKLEPSDLLITITGNGVGNVAHVPDEWAETAFVSQHVGLVRFNDPQLALLATHHFVEGAPGNQQIVSAQYGQSKPGLSLENLRGFWIPIPAEGETSVINSKIACAYERLAQEEGLAHQLRSLKLGLMDDLLTGRVRVTPLLESVQQATAPTEA